MLLYKYYVHAVKRSIVEIRICMVKVRLYPQGDVVQPCAAHRTIAANSERRV
jgi:hypothetical protein